MKDLGYTSKERINSMLFCFGKFLFDFIETT